MQNIYEKRPFKIRNADEYELENILELFINPRSKIHNPFEYENSIVKGQMGSGKTMYLRSNYAFHLYSLVPNIVDHKDFVLPVFIRLSDYQHILNPKEIYSSIVISIMKEITSLYKKLEDVEGMAALHKGITHLPKDILNQQAYNEVVKEIVKLETEQYKERFKEHLKGSGSAGNKFIKAAAEFGKEKEVELTTNKEVSIQDVHNAYEKLLAPYSGKLLILFDEAGSLNKSFFKPVDGGSSYFETLMNQLRTSQHLRTKIAIYPQTYSDILKETRYGDVIQLHFDVVDLEQHSRFRKKVIELISNYLTKAVEKEVDESLIFEGSPSQDGGDIVEQLIYASGGNLRTFVHLLDLSMLEAYDDHEGNGKTTTDHAIKAISKYAKGIESLFSESEQDFLNTVVKSCKSRGTYKFQFPNMSPILSKYTSKTSEINILNILEIGTGRKGTMYAFDYTYCIYKDIPTHHLKGSQKIDKTRSLLNGEWIRRVQKLSDEIIEHANIEDKITGIIDYVHNDAAFVISEQQEGTFFLSKSNIIQADKKSLIVEGKSVRFYPASLPSGAKIALAIEMLD